MESPIGVVEATDLHVAAAFRAFRIANGLKIQELATFLGVAYGTVHKYERGEIRIFADTLLRAATLFGVPVTEFFPGAQMLRRGSQGRAQRERISRIAAFVVNARRIPSAELQDALARVTRLILEGQPSAST
ncbi:transcriptional regulator [Roseomonas fluvialis]|uniref:Transcriptional regulator n=1 Tax=Roseomonas fluvialis TaxID=1750527 RepID=A0ABN6P8Y6_9PROT|nr:transcriptional regulator [Roseomonas fluvialis]